MEPCMNAVINQLERYYKAKKAMIDLGTMIDVALFETSELRIVNEQILNTEELESLYKRIRKLEATLAYLNTERETLSKELAQATTSLKIVAGLPL